MKRLAIAVLYGGDSSEYEVSVRSAQVVIDELRKSDFDVFPVEVKKTQWNCETPEGVKPINKHDFFVEQSSGSVKFDMAFIIIHGTPGEDGKIQGYFDVLGVPYSTSGQIASAITFDKMACSSLLKRFGISMAEACYLTRNDTYDIDIIIQKTGLPCFVKPNRAGSSFGITKVKSRNELADAVEYAFTFDSKVIIEEFVSGDEVTCGIHDVEGEVNTLPLTEIVSKNEFFDYQAKYEGASDEITPARIKDEVRDKIWTQSKEIFNILDLRGVCRIDYIVRGGEPYFIEVNTVPGMSKPSIVPQQLLCAGYSLDEFFKKWTLAVLNEGDGRI